jgi:hypothetical protein
MSANASAVYAGVGQDLVTGTCLIAPYGTALPVHTSGFFEASLDAAFKDAGYIGEAGITLSQGRSSTDIKDMDGTIIDSVQTEFNGTIASAFLELNEVTLGNLVGADNVVATASDSTKGNRLAVAITGEDLSPVSMIFRMKSGNKRAALIVPQARVTDIGDLAFNLSGAASLDVTIKTIPTYDAGSSKNVNCWLILDDGVLALSTVPTIDTALPTGRAVGELITVKGDRFTGTTGVTVGGVSVGAVNVGFSIVSDDELVVKVPSGTAGSAPIIVTNASGASAAKAYTRGA